MLIPVFDFDPVKLFATQHREDGILAKQERLSRDFIADAAAIAQHGTVLDIYRFYNTEDAVRQNNLAYLYIARVGDD